MVFENLTTDVIEILKCSSIVEHIAYQGDTAFIDFYILRNSMGKMYSCWFFDDCFNCLIASSRW